MNIIIKEGTLNTLPEVAKLHISCWQHNFKGIIEQDLLDNLEQEIKLEKRQHFVQNNPGSHIIAVLNDQVVGFCDIGPLYFRANQIISPSQRVARSERGEIYALYVDPPYQHLGIGTKLFQAVTKLLAERELTPFLVWVLKENHLSRRFYEKSGGKAVAEISLRFWNKQYQVVGYCY